MKITQEELVATFKYKEGHLYHRFRDSETATGCLKHTGYREMGFKYNTYPVHRLIYLYHYGYIPKYVDHINGDRADNRIENLREASNSQNMANAIKYKVNKTSGYKGVQSVGRRWNARICVNRKDIYLGTFQTKEEAAKAYNQAALLYFKEYAQLNILPPDK